MPVRSNTPASSRHRGFAYSFATLTFAFSFCWWALDLNLAATFLVTPVNPATLRIAWILGAVVGAWVAILGLLSEIRQREVPMHKARSTFLIIVVGAACAIFGIMIANDAVWRVANVYLFWSSRAPVVREFFPIREVLPRNGTLAVSVGLQGEGRRLGISRKDYDLLRGAGTLERPWVYCLSLRQQREGEAVRVWRPPHLRVRSDAVTIVHCPEAVRMIE